MGNSAGDTPAYDRASAASIDQCLESLAANTDVDNRKGCTVTGKTSTSAELPVLPYSFFGAASDVGPDLVEL